jgi:DNA-binding CsgD family transcriptional regulator
MIAQIVRIESDSVLAEQAWRDGDVLGAIEAADRALAAGTDSGGVAAGIAAAGAAADGAVLDAAARWRGVGSALDGAAAARAVGRAALASALVGDVSAAVGDLADARDQLPDPAPRGLTVLLGAAGAVVEAMGGALDTSARHLAGLAAASVAPDPMAAERLDELAVVVTAAGGDLDVARARLHALPGEPTARRHLLGAWLDMRTGHLGAAREALAAAARTPVLRRDALLGAAVSVGLARRTGDSTAVAATWARVAPVVAGTDVELLLLDAWGELSVVAEQVSSTADRDLVVDAMRTALHRAGSPWWGVAVDRWWQLERAVVADDADAAAEAAAGLTALADDHPQLRGRADAATAWAAVLAGRVCPATVDAAAARLADAGLRDEAAALCRAAAQRATDPAATRRLLGAGRGLRPAAGGARASGLLSDREREVGALVLDGLTQKEIGARLDIAPQTVEQHVARMRQKLAASNRATLVAALRTHLGS